MPITYTVAVDWDDDGDFSDDGEDITADVLALRWRLGMAAAHDGVAAPIAAQITLRNRSRDYSPEDTPIALLPGKGVRISSHDGTTSRRHFTGFIAHIEPEPGDQGSRRSLIYAHGPDAQLASHRIRLPPQVNVSADAVIEAILDAAPLRRIALKDTWILDAPDHHALGTSTRLAAITIARTLETGVSTFAYVGDSWGSGISAADALQQMVDSERGRFFIDREGGARFINRHHTLYKVTSDATFEDTMAGMVYRFGGDIVNRVDVRLTPRSIGAAGSVLWTLDSSQRLLPGHGNAREIIARYRDADGNPLGALHVQRPEAQIDFEANTDASGSGLDATADVSVRILHATASAATLRLRNRRKEPVYLLAGARLRGTPIQMGDPLIVSETDWASLAFYGESRLGFDLPALDAIEHADQVARFELARRREPRGVATHLTLDAPRHLPHALARTLFDRITVREAQTGHDADYFIVGEAHEVDLGGARHRVTWTLESASANAFWVVGAAEIDRTASLAY